MDLKKEVLAFLKKNDDGDYLLVEPHLLYLKDKQVDSYLKAMKNESYSSGFHSDTVEIIKENLKSIFDQMEKVTLVDLGPGYPDKSLPMAKWTENRVECNYYPVDVSELYLKVASGAIKEYVNTVNPIHSKFEDLPPNSIIEGLSTKTVMLGLTFMNFDSKFILSLLKTIAGSGGKVIIASELRSKGVEDIVKCSSHELRLQNASS